jgi:poly-beta-1,6-N-acetyl-D-glucosamine N-deacetylase
MVRKSVGTILAFLLVLAGCNGPQDGGSVTVDDPNAKFTGGETPAEPARPEIALEAMNRRTPIIMYHDIIEKRGRQSVWFDCTVKEFQEQMDKIEEGGWTPISMRDLYDHLSTGKTIPEKSLVLTFDDNYQGFYDHAWPILKEKGWPAMMFVHTGFVGKKEGSHPKMDWETLKELLKDPLFSVGSHTVNHKDMPTLTDVEQRTELAESKATLESELGIPIDFLSYPEGKHNDVTVNLSRELGYKMAVTITNTPAELSPGILRVGRYIHTRLEKALEDAEKALASAPGTSRVALIDKPVMYEEFDAGRFTIAMIRGGKTFTITSETRESVSEFIERSPGTVAGINGTFFNMAAIVATDNKLVGPCITPDKPELVVDDMVFRYEKLRNRPLIMWNDTEFMITPFVPERHNDAAQVALMMPDIKNLFLGGAWLVHNGVAFEEDQLRAFATQDVMDFRRRAAFGVLQDGSFFAAAAKNSVSSEQFAKGLAEAGAKEAILLDSGFSTSLVYNKKILASGHSTKEKPSRPVPHAILFTGELDPASVEIAEKAIPATIQSGPRRRSRR